MQKRQITSLYIIGNGFDCFHKLSTRYIDFYHYCNVHEDDYFLWNLNEIFPKLDNLETNWNNFEAQLSNFSIDSSISDEIQEYLKTLESHQDDYIDYELVHTFINEPLKRYYIIISKLRQKFKNWVESISISDSHSIFKIRKDSVFLTFNYTKTLEVLYNIDESQICHIHGKVGDKELIFGHDWEHNITFDSLNDININQSNQEQEFNRRIFDEFKDQIINPLKKNPINIIENTPFFYELENLKIKNIIVLGHSLSNVDIPYFEEIYERVNNVKWFISFYNEEDRKKIEMFKKRFNLDDNCCQIIHMKDLLHMNIK